MERKQWSQSVASQWSLFLPPTRPSLSELALIEQRILREKARKKNYSIAILGSTPEYRDLCQTYSIAYRCIEYNAKNFSMLGDFMLHPDTKEHLLVADWRTMRFREHFDCFIGDLVTTVVSVQYHEDIFRNIREHCRPSALVMLKVPLRKNNRQMTHQQIFRLYRKRYKYLNPFAAVWHEVLMADYDFAKDAMHCQTSLRSLRQSYRSGVITAYEFGEFKKRWDAVGDFSMNVPLRRAYLQKIRQNFTIESVTSGTDWYRQWTPVLILRPRA